MNKTLLSSNQTTIFKIIIYDFRLNIIDYSYHNDLKNEMRHTLYILHSIPYNVTYIKIQPFPPAINIDNDIRSTQTVPH